MIKISIKQNGVETNAAKFKTMHEADLWIAAQEKLKSFGKPARIVAEDMIAAEGEDLSKAIEVFEEETHGIVVKFYRFAAEYTVEKQDVTLEENKRLKQMQGRMAQEIGADIISKVYQMNEDKGLTPAQFQAFVSDVEIERIERFLWQGSLKTVVVLLQNMTSPLVSAEEKAFVLAEVQAGLARLAALENGR